MDTKRLCAALLCASFVALGPSAQAAEATYDVQSVSATWVRETTRADKPNMYRIEARRYEDQATGEVSLFFHAIRLKCERQESGGLRCGGLRDRFRNFDAYDGEFEMAEDMESAHVSFTVDGHLFEANFVDPELTDQPTKWLPGTYETQESCPEGNGTGSGFMRFTDASGKFISKRLEPEREDDKSRVARYTITTDCPPGRTVVPAFSEAVDKTPNL